MYVRLEMSYYIFNRLSKKNMFQVFKVCLGLEIKQFIMLIQTVIRNKYDKQSQFSVLYGNMQALECWIKYIIQLLY